jgi:hypothetical protein
MSDHRNRVGILQSGVVALVALAAQVTPAMAACPFTLTTAAPYSGLSYSGHVDASGVTLDSNTFCVGTVLAQASNSGAWMSPTRSCRIQGPQSKEITDIFKAVKAAKNQFATSCGFAPSGNHPAITGMTVQALR